MYDRSHYSPNFLEETGEWKGEFIAQGHLVNEGQSHSKDSEIFVEKNISLKITFS